MITIFYPRSKYASTVKNTYYFRNTGLSCKKAVLQKKIRIQ